MVIRGYKAPENAARAQRPKKRRWRRLASSGYINTRPASNAPRIKNWRPNGKRKSPSKGQGWRGSDPGRHKKSPHYGGCFHILIVGVSFNISAKSRVCLFFIAKRICHFSDRIPDIMAFLSGAYLHNIKAVFDANANIIKAVFMCLFDKSHVSDPP